MVILAFAALLEGNQAVSACSNESLKNEQSMKELRNARLQNRSRRPDYATPAAL
jgi:hypothetical protein